MPYEDPDSTDPMVLHGTMLETDDDQAVRDMAECFVEEFIRSGASAEQIMSMFQNPDYAGPHLAFQALGAPGIAALIDEQVQRWGPRRGRKPVDRNARGDVILPVLDQ